jgi:hypothetical protein
MTDDTNEGTAITVQLSAVPAFTEIQQSMIRAVATFGAKVYDVSTPDGLAVAKSDASDINGYLIKLEKSRKAAKQESLDYGRLIDGEAKRIREPVESMLAPLQAMIDAEKNKAARIEAERKAAITARIDAMNRRPPWGATSGEIKAMLEKVEAVVIDDLFCEYQDDAAVAKMTAVKELREMHAGAVANETAKADADRLRREAAERAKADAEGAAAAIAPPLPVAAGDPIPVSDARPEPIVRAVAEMVMAECIADIAAPAVALLRIVEIVDEYPWSFGIDDDDLAQIHLIGMLAKAGLK